MNIQRAIEIVNHQILAIVYGPTLVDSNGPNHQISASVFGPKCVRLLNAPKIYLVTLISFEIFDSFTKFFEIYKNTQIPPKVLNHFHKIHFPLISI